MEQSKKEKGTINSTQDSVKNQVQDSKKTTITPPIINELSNVIDQELSSNNSFPIDIFPQQIQELIKNAENTVGFHPDYFSAGILSISATAIGNSVNLSNGSYTSQPILWLAIIGRTGNGKTNPLKFAKRPIENMDKKFYQEYQELQEKYENEDNKGKKPTFIKSILTDFTIEKLAESLQYNEKGVLIFKDELIGWINSFDQYKKGGDQQKYLESWNGDILSVDRVSKPPIRVEKSNINILGGLQPKKLKGLASNDRMDDGFLARMLFVYPTILKPFLFTGEFIKTIHIDNYNRLISNLYQVSDTELSVTKKQIKIYQEWHHKAAIDSFPHDIEASIQSKLETYVWRFALIIEMIYQASKSEFKNTISDASLEKAIKLAEYFRINALIVFERITTNNPLQDLHISQVDLFKKLPPNFKRAEVLPLFEEHGLKGGTIGRFLNKKDLFKRLDNSGNYKKLIL